MLVKIVTLFLVGMVIVALIGRLRWPRGGRGAARRGADSGRVAPPTICGHCGRFIVGKGDCDCQRRG